ncbi:MAG: formate dehydrogenase subunit gamma [Deltaproteobacteria bacterium]|nr:formate dehydrogenase subunit gamma [Deltaproteobacteria bacterium]
MIPNPKELKRFTPQERANHWLVAIGFVLAALSGLTFFHPAFWPLSELFGGGVWTRILHPFIGLLLAILFVSMFLRFRSLNRITPDDREWLTRVGELVGGSSHEMPPQEKFNAGEKVLFWALSTSLLVMVLSGLVMWRAFYSLPVALVRFASVVHAAFGALIIGLIFGHIYAAIWTRGTLHAMVFGTVSRAWAKHHHATWYRQMTGG